ncbi:hypothetical protein [Larkinella soli]|uniref:hypothetical protein n=1 Tax=Larkinella soli TaxID=1770527 RepID=UPI000FFC21BC|nr:hypothetical protein [Larkinella soli]
MKKAVWMLWTGSVLFFGCRSGRDDEAQPKSRAELITRVWEIRTSEMALGTVDATVYTKGGTQNALDMTRFRLDFKPDGKVIQTGLDGTAKTYSWQLLENDTKWVISDATSEDRWDIDSLTENRFHYHRRISGSSKDPGDLEWLRLLQNYGLPTAQGVKLTVKMIPAP